MTLPCAPSPPRALLLASTALPLLLASAMPAAAQVLATERVSIASDGMEGDNHSFDPAISADGRFVAFRSSASNLVAGDTNHTHDIFVYDRNDGLTTRVSVADDGTQAHDLSIHSAISASGRFVAFGSVAGLVPEDTYGFEDIFVHDRENGATERTSVASDGTQANSSSYSPSIGADGNFVAFRDVFVTTLDPSPFLDSDGDGVLDSADIASTSPIRGKRISTTTATPMPASPSVPGSSRGQRSASRSEWVHRAPSAAAPRSAIVPFSASVC